MHIVLRVAVVLYVLFLLFYAVQGAFLIYHLRRFSVRPDLARVFAGVFVVVSAGLLLVSAGLFFQIPWRGPLSPSGVPPASLTP